MAFHCRGQTTETPATEAPSEYHGRWKEYFKTSVAEYTFTSADDKPFTVSKEPVQSYFLGGRDEYNHAALFVWSHQGRAEVVASFWCIGHPGQQACQIVHEFQSLSLETFQAKRNGRVVWEPRGSAISFEPIPGASEPKSNRAVRLAQMHALARQFEGFELRPAKERLRLLEQPLYRYEEQPADADILDGALFALLYDWDPEVMLIIEARKTDHGYGWRFAAARFGHVTLLEHNGKEVWSSQRDHAIRDATGASHLAWGAATVTLSSLDQFKEVAEKTKE